MRRAAAFLVAVFFAVPSFAAWGKQQEYFHAATPEELAMKSLPSAPGAPAAILEILERQDDEASSESEYVRMKIFTGEGKKYADLELVYLPRIVTIRDLKARTLHPDGSIAELDPNKVYDKLIVRAGGVRVMAKTFSIPDVQPGSIVEYTYTPSWPSEHLAPTSRWWVQRDVPMLKYSLWVKPYGMTSRQTGISSFFTSVGIPKDKMPQKNGDHFEATLEDIPAFEKEAYAPPENELKPRIELHYTTGEMDLTEFWTAEGAGLSMMAEDFIGDRSGIRKAAQELTAGAATPVEKLQKIYARVQQLRNTSFDEEKTIQESSREKLRDNRYVEDVLRNGYGSRSELTRLFVALARGAGFEASIARIGTRDDLFVIKDLPVSGQLDTEVAIVMLDGKMKYFDPGTPFAPFGILSWEKTDTLGLQLSRKVAERWIKTPMGAATDALTRRKADLHLDGDVLKGTVTITWNGQEALQRRLQRHHDDETANRKAFEDELKGHFPDGSNVKLAGLTGIKGIDEPLVATYDVELPNLGTFTGTRALLPLSIFTATAKNPFAPEQRKNPIYFDYLFQNEDEVTVRLPEGYTVESVPANANINLGAAGYSSEWGRTEDALTFKRKFFIGTIYIEKDRYPTVRGFYSKVGVADQEAVVLRKAAQ